MRQRLLLVPLVLALGGCNCFVPVEECVGLRCTRLPDGGKRDGGVADAGRTDAGRTDAGVVDREASCSIWDGGGVGKCAALTGYVAAATVCRGECVLFPIETAGVYPSLAACVGCGCDLAKLSTRPAQAFGPQAFCDQVAVTTALPRLLEEAFPGLDAGCTPVGAVDYECVLLSQRVLGDAGYARSCGATLIPYVSDVQCRVFVK